MANLDFRLTGLSQKHLRRWRQRAQPRRPLTELCAGAAIPLLILMSIVYATGVFAPHRRAEFDTIHRVSALVPVRFSAVVSVDKHGNPLGDRFDLVPDRAFEGRLVAVLHLYTGEGFDFRFAQAALEKKGFRVRRWTSVPTPAELAEVLKKASQLWIISTRTQLLTQDHLDLINNFFRSGHGIYLWGDNQPFYADANYVGKALIGVTMDGNMPGAQIIGLQTAPQGPGFARHPIMKGIRKLFEGVTVATIGQHPDLDPLVYGSAGNVVVAIYDRGGKRAVIDGGSTRLFLGWDQAGSARYVQNAAAWLVNIP